MRISNNDDHIRARLFRKLGIDAMVAESKYASDAEMTKCQQRKMLDETVVALEEPLKFHGEPSGSARRNGARIKFNPVVKVLTISSHSMYSDRIKKVIWSNSAEIKQNANRNIREFAAEGWNWEKVVEEDEMFLDKCANEYIHPVHLGFL